MKLRAPLNVAMVGFGLHIAAMFEMLIDGALEPTSTPSGPNDIFFLLVLLGLLLSSFCALDKRVNRVIKASTHVSLTGAALAIPLVVCRVLFHLGSPVFFLEAASWFLLGISFGILLISWGAVWTQADGLQESNYVTAKRIAASACIGGLLSYVFSFATGISATLLACLAYFAAAAAQCFALHQLPAQEDIDIEASRTRFRYISKALPAPIVSGFCLGTLIQLSTMDHRSEPSALPLLLCIACGSFLLLAFSAATKRTVKHSLISHVMYPVLGICVILWPYAPATWHYPMLAIAVTTVAAYFVSFWNVLVELSYRHHTLPCYHFALGLTAPFGGIAAGWSLGLLSQAYGNDCAGQILVICTAVVLAAFIKPPGDDYANRNAYGAAPSHQPKENEDSWNELCQDACSCYRLTPRESEVLPYLARGRNAEHIGKALFISPNTVKSHIGRIYRKMGVASQQELIDIVEQIRKASR